MNLHNVALSLVLVTLAGCNLKGLVAKADDAGTTASPAAEAGATAAAPVDAGAPPDEATNKGDLARFPAEKPLDGAAATIKIPKAVVQTSPGSGETVATLKTGDTVTLVSEFKTFDRVLFANPKDASKKLGGWIAKSAFEETTAKARAGIPTCPAGQVMGTEAMSPFKPFCGAKCKTDADCKGVSCTTVNALNPDGTSPPGENYIKLCDPEYKITPGAAKSGATPTPSAPAATKCKPNQHFDDIDKKCRALGDCPKGYRWNDPMQSCVMDG